MWRTTVKQQDQVNNASSAFIFKNHLISRGLRSGPGGPGVWKCFFLILKLIDANCSQCSSILMCASALAKKLIQKWNDGKKMLLMLTPGRAALANVSHLYHSQANTHTDTKHTHIDTKDTHAHSNKICTHNDTKHAHCGILTQLSNHKSRITMDDIALVLSDWQCVNPCHTILPPCHHIALFRNIFPAWQ